MKISDFPKELLQRVREAGPCEWGATADASAEQHGEDLKNSIRLTSEFFDQVGDQQMHGLYLANTDVILCHTGTSPNSPMNAQILCGLWNWVFENLPKEGE